MDAVDLVEIKDCADVRMIERRSEASFAFEAFEVRFFRGEFGGQDLDHKGAAELRINSLIDRSLTALTELLEDLVIPQRRTDHSVFVSAIPICHSMNA